MILPWVPQTPRGPHMLKLWCGKEESNWEHNAAWFRGAELSAHNHQAFVSMVRFAPINVLQSLMTCYNKQAFCDSNANLVLFFRTDIVVEQ